MKTQKAHVPALTPVNGYAVEFVTPDYENQPSEKLSRFIVATDEMDAASAVKKYFAVDRIISMTQRWMYVIPSAS